MDTAPMGGPQPLNSSPNNTKMIVIGGVVVIILVVAAYMLLARSEDEAGLESDVTTIEQEELLDSEADVAAPVRTSPAASSLTSPTTAPSGVAAAVKTFNVTGSNFKFDQTEMRVKQGETVRLIFSNPDSMPHDWRVDEFNAATKVITNGQTDTVEFVASKKGTFEYYCSVGQHRQQGMVGKLIVE